jgi:hypothetical protein
LGPDEFWMPLWNPTLNPSDEYERELLWMPAPEGNVDPAFVDACDAVGYANTGKWLLVSLSGSTRLVHCTQASAGPFKVLQPIYVGFYSHIFVLCEYLWAGCITQAPCRDFTICNAPGCSAPALPCGTMFDCSTAVDTM